MNTILQKKYINLSLFSVTACLLIVSFHHIYRFGPPLMLPFLGLTMIPSVIVFFLIKIRKDKGTEIKTILYTVIRWLYIVYVLLVVLAFGIQDGGLDHVFKAIGIPHISYLEGSELMVVKTFYNFISPEVSYWIYEGSGLLQTITSFFVMYYLVKFIQYTK